MLLKRTGSIYKVKNSSRLIEEEDAKRKSGRRITALFWGWGSQGQLGHGDHEARVSPAMVPSISRNPHGIADIACGSRFSVALTREGSIYTFGKGEDGQLGHGDRFQQPTPRLVGRVESSQLLP